MTIKEIRQLTNLTQQKFCDKYGIPLVTLRKWEQGHRSPPGYLVELLEFKVKEDLKMDNITPEEFYQKMIEIRKTKGFDEEDIHRDMDDLLCETLKQLGYSKGVEVFEDTHKWYA